MTSAAWRASFGNDGSPMRSPSGRMNSHLPGVLLHRILQELEKFRDGRQNPVPVGDERETSRILDEFVRGRAQALCKDCHGPVSYTHLRAHETGRNLVCRLLLEKK